MRQLALKEAMLELLRAARPFAEAGNQMPETWKSDRPYKNQVGGPRRPTIGEFRELDRAYRDALRYFQAEYPFGSRKP